MTKSIRFVKMEGVGNDFVVVPAELLDGIDPSKAAIQLCERRFGIGSDGLLTVGLPEDNSAAFSFRMYNPDGTSDICGNGLRCATLFAQQAGLLMPVSGDIKIETLDGIFTAEILDVGQRERTARVRVELGVPRFAAADIPFTGSDEGPVIDYPLIVGDTPVTITAVNTGSTHAVIFVDEHPSEYEFQTLSPLIENHRAFPSRTSIMWATRTGPTEFVIRIWERAASETLACGTGACAVAAAAIVKNLASHGAQIDILSKGGALKVMWPGKDAPIQLTGPARWVYEGQANVELPA